jgi:hypothetical protein
LSSSELVVLFPILTWHKQNIWHSPLYKA